MNGIIVQFLLCVLITFAVELSIYILLETFLFKRVVQVLDYLLVIFINVFSNATAYAFYNWVHIPWLVVEI